MIYYKMLGGFVLTHSLAIKVEVHSRDGKLAPHPNPPYPFSYLVSVSRCAERLNPCSCALSAGTRAQSFSDQRRVWLTAKYLLSEGRRAHPG